VAVATYAANVVSELPTQQGLGVIAAPSTGLSHSVSGPEPQPHRGRRLQRGALLATRSWPDVWPHLNDATTCSSEGWSRYCGGRSTRPDRFVRALQHFDPIGDVGLLWDGGVRHGPRDAVQLALAAQGNERTGKEHKTESSCHAWCPRAPNSPHLPPHGYRKHPVDGEWGSYRNRRTFPRLAADCAG